MGNCDTCFSRSALPENQENTIILPNVPKVPKQQSENSEREKQAVLINLNAHFNTVSLKSAAKGYLTRKMLASQLKNYQASKVLPSPNNQTLSQHNENFKLSEPEYSDLSLSSFEVEVLDLESKKSIKDSTIKLEDSLLFNKIRKKARKAKDGSLLLEDNKEILTFLNESGNKDQDLTNETHNIIPKEATKNSEDENEEQDDKSEYDEDFNKDEDQKVKEVFEKYWPDGTKYIDQICYYKKIQDKATSNLYEKEIRGNFLLSKDEKTKNKKNVYQGAWKNNKKHGQGVYKWADGSVYSGNWKRDLRDGYGEMIWPDGSKYEGGWRKGKQHGNGSYMYMTNNELITQTGIWSDGVINEED
jgi:hypothetical protein